MKSIFSALFLAGLFSASIGAAAQQTGKKPVLSATPVPAQTTAPETPAASVPAAAPANVSATYVIGADDSIQVTVWKEPTLSGTFPVRPDGMISLPLIGDIAAEGRTPMDLSKDLTAGLKKYVTDPTVTVSVLSVNSKRIFMLGEVARIGPIPLTSTMTPLQAIATAGGLSAFAKKSHIYILRGEQGKQKKIPFDYKKAIKDGNQQGVVLQPGDTIVVP